MMFHDSSRSRAAEPDPATIKKKSFGVRLKNPAAHRTFHCCVLNNPRECWRINFRALAKVLESPLFSPWQQLSRPPASSILPSPPGECCGFHLSHPALGNTELAPTRSRYSNKVSLVSRFPNYATKKKKKKKKEEKGQIQLQQANTDINFLHTLHYFCSIGSRSKSLAP